MSTFTSIIDGTNGSAVQVSSAFNGLRTQGQEAINTLVTLRENTLLLFNNNLAELQNKKTKANRLDQIGLVTQFITSDLLDVNQGSTTSTIRCDCNSVSLRERTAPGEAVISSVTFSTSDGVIQVLNNPQLGSSGDLGALYRVVTQDNGIPTGTFSIQLDEAVDVLFVSIDTIDMPSDPNISISVSTNGITYTQATSISNNGSRIAAWFTPQKVQYIQIVITPALPDILNGNIFTFGVMDIHAFSIQYYLRSNFYTNQIQIVPQSANVQFNAPSSTGLIYFLSLGGQPSVEVNPGDILPVPGTSSVVNQNVTLINNAGVWAQLNYTLPSNTYLSTLTVTDASSGVSIRVAPGLSNTVTGLTNQYIAVSSNLMYLLPYNQANDGTRTFNVSYVAGPSTSTAQLQVQLTTSDLNTTPIFTGASLEAV